MKKAVLDTGPIVALFNKNDIYHSLAVDFIKNFQGTLFSSLAIFTEVCYLLDFSIRAQRDFLKWIEMGAVKTIELIPDDYCRISELMDKYQRLPMDFADGTIVAICEKIETKEIVTVDKDFEIYRYKNKGVFKNLFPA